MHLEDWAWNWLKVASATFCLSNSQNQHDSRVGKPTPPLRCSHIAKWGRKGEQLEK